MSDFAKLKSFTMGTYGVTPYVFETTGDDFIEIYYVDSGLTLGEILYTARGS